MSSLPLRQPTDRAILQYERAVQAFLKEFFPWTIEAEGTQPELAFAQPVEEFVAGAAEALATRMLRSVAQVNAKTWRAAASKSLHGKQIFEALRTEMGGALGTRVDEIRAANAQLLLQLPARVAKRAAAFIASEQRRGRRSEAIAKSLQKQMPDVIRTRVRMMARTEIGRAETAFTRARSERLGLDWYVWATSEDGRVRASHRKLAEVLVNWNDPPSPEELAHEGNPFGHYHPGTVPNCRCLALPLVDLNEVRWPHKVYSHGKIEYVSRAQFERWIRVPAVA
jgi:SPP1 gp7 family putative phage head morphogenesis protein